MVCEIHHPRHGTILKRFEPKVKPDSPEVLDAIQEALAAKQAAVSSN